MKCRNLNFDQINPMKKHKAGWKCWKNVAHSIYFLLLSIGLFHIKSIFTHTSLYTVESLDKKERDLVGCKDAQEADQNAKKGSVLA